MNRRRWTGLSACLILLALLETQSGASWATIRHSQQQPMAHASNQFALDLYQQLSSRDGNLFFSPYSISKALAMTSAGARGETAAEMAAVLHFNSLGQDPHQAFAELRKSLNSKPDPRVQMQLAAALWGQKGYGFQKTFLNLLRDNYGAGLGEVDFKASEQARQTINRWVDKQTAGRIPELFASGTLDSFTRLVLTSAIYFKGDWAVAFPKDSTRPAPFHVSRDRQVKVQMMNQTETFGYLETDSMQALQMPYAGKDLALLVLLPREVDGLAKLEKTLTAQNLAAWSTRLREQEVQVYFPRFRMTGEFDLPETLKALGMKKAFNDSEADFSGMNGGRDQLYLSAVVHKAFIDLNEQGTEAAAATGGAVAVPLAAPSFRPVVPVFRADHPFLFAIRDVRTGVILFLGRYSQP